MTDVESLDIQKIVHNGVEILYLNYQGKDDVGIFELTLRFREYFSKVPDNSLRLLIDVRGLNVTFKNYTNIKETAKESQIKIHKSVYLGLNLYSKTLHNVYRTFTKSRAVLLSNYEESLKYLSE